jgi:hypothetical protein
VRVSRRRGSQSHHRTTQACKEASRESIMGRRRVRVARRLSQEAAVHCRTTCVYFVPYLPTLAVTTRSGNPLVSGLMSFTSITWTWTLKDFGLACEMSAEHTHGVSHRPYPRHARHSPPQDHSNCSLHGAAAAALSLRTLTSPSFFPPAFLSPVLAPEGPVAALLLPTALAGGIRTSARATPPRPAQW